MDTTSTSLLGRLQQPAAQEAWIRFVHLYTPLLYTWAREVGLQDSDAADLVQDVLTLLVQKLPTFAYDPQKSFRAWLRTVLVNRWRDGYQPVRASSLEGQDVVLVAPDHVCLLEETEYRRYLVGRALQLMQADFQPVTWKACWEYVVSGRPATEVAQELGLTVNAVYHAKARVLARLRQELAGLLS